eukprot:scaffold76852_cov34-Prasinocladus_malaysianus.AAC.2
MAAISSVSTVASGGSSNPLEASQREPSHPEDESYGSSLSDVERTPVARASQLGVLARLAAAAGFPQQNRRSLTLAELAGQSDGAENASDPGGLAGLMEALVQLKVVEPGEEPQTFRIANASVAGRTDAVNDSHLEADSQTIP